MGEKRAVPEEVADKRALQQPAGSGGQSPAIGKRLKMDDSAPKPGKAFSLIFDSNVTNSCSEFSPLDLQSHPRAARPWRRLRGLQAAKQALINCIRLPISNPGYFAVHPSFFGRDGSAGNTPIERVLSIYGPHGMGRSRLVYNLCRENGLTLLDVQPVRFDPFNDIATIYAKAVEQAPSLVLFDDCDGFFHDNGTLVGLLRYHLAKVSDGKIPVWTVFLSHCRPSTLHADVRPTADCQIPVSMLDIAERSEVFDRALVERIYAKESPTELDALDGNYAGLLTGFDAGVLGRCRNACKDYTPLEIHQWIDRVFGKKLIRQTHLLGLYDRTNELFRPSSDEFTDMLYKVPNTTQCRLTEQDPFQTNVQPYMDKEEQRLYRQNEALQSRPPPRPQIDSAPSHGFEESWQ